MSAPYREGSVAVGGAGISGDPESPRAARGRRRRHRRLFRFHPSRFHPSDGIPIPGVSDVSAPALADVSPSSPSPTGSGFPRSRFSSPTCTRTRYDRFGAISRRATRVRRGRRRRPRAAFPRAPRRSTSCTSTTAARWRSARNRFGTCSRGTPSRTGRRRSPRFPRGANARGGPKRRRWRRARARVRRGGGRARVRTRGKCRGGGRVRVGTGRGSLATHGLRRALRVDRGQGRIGAVGSRRRPPRRPPRADPSPRLSANTPSPSPPRGTIISACATRSGVDDAFGPRGAAAADASRGRPRERRGGCGGATSPPLSRGGRRTSRRGRTDAPLCWTRGRVEGEDACVCTRSNASSGRTTRCASVGGARVRAARGGGGAAGTGTGRRVPSREDARLLASLAREVVVAAGAGAELAAAPAVVGGAGAGAPSGEAVYERCFFLYGTLMFFVFRVRVRNRRRGRGPGFGNAPFT